MLIFNDFRPGKAKTTIQTICISDISDYECISSIGSQVRSNYFHCIEVSVEITEAGAKGYKES